jgi:cytochrome P450
LTNFFFLLSRHPRVWKKLKEEVNAVGHFDLDWDCISRLKYVRMVLNEGKLSPDHLTIRFPVLDTMQYLTNEPYALALRLYPVLPNINRTSLTSTFLPCGGGSDGKSSIYIPKGTIFSTSSYALHRDTTIWGTDAADFVPECWDKGFQPNPGAYIPLGAGPRVCMGQQKALIESGYIVARMEQEFSAIESRDEREWMGHLQLIVKNAHGCVVSLKSSWIYKSNN